MKKLLLCLAVVMGLLLFPQEVDAKHYRIRKGHEDPNLPIREPVLYQIGVELDSISGDLYISPNFNATNLHVTVTANGFTYLNVTTSLTSGQVYADSLAFLDEGIYLMTISIGNIVFSQYEVTVED